MTNMRPTQLPSGRWPGFGPHPMEIPPYGSWDAWRLRIKKWGDNAVIAIDDDEVPDDDSWRAEHVAQLPPDHIIQPPMNQFEVAHAVAERSAG